MLRFVGWNWRFFQGFVLNVVSWHRKRQATIYWGLNEISHNEDTFLCELSQYRLSYKLVKIVIINFRALSFCHASVVKGKFEFPLRVLPHYVCVLKQIGLW